MPASVFNSPLGRILLQSADGYITCIRFLDDEPEPDQDEDPLLADAILQLDQYFKGERKLFDFPVRQEGSPFQQKVWELLMQLPFGKTESYLSLSKRFGDPKAIRAVASANGRNNLAIVVPCHRVIGSNGSLTGYAGGLWRKQWLLRHEAKAVQGEMFGGESLEFRV